MPDTTTPSQQKTNDFFRVAFLSLLMIVLIVMAFLAGLLVQREFLSKRNNNNNTNTTEPTPTPTTNVSPSATATPTPTVQPTETRKTYTNSRYGFQLNYPASWTAAEELNNKCSQNTPGTHICQYVSVTSPTNTTTAFRMEITNSADNGVLGNYTSLDTTYKGYQRQAKQLNFNGVKVDRVLFLKDSTIKFICYIPSGFECGKGVIPMQDVSIQMYVGNPAGDANNLVAISAADVEVIDTIVASFKKQ